MPAFSQHDDLRDAISRNAIFRNVDLSGARLHSVKLHDVKLTDAWLSNVDISGLIGGLTINGIDVTGYVMAEVLRREPERALLSPSNPDDLRKAWTMIETRWAATLERAQKLPEPALHESVDGEWSFVETLRHLVFATDRWFTGPVLGEPHPYAEIGLPPGPPDDGRQFGLDPDARPSFHATLAVRRERLARVAAFVERCRAEDLAQRCNVPGMGTPTALSCLHVVLDEEWSHCQYAARDLAHLEA